ICRSTLRWMASWESVHPSLSTIGKDWPPRIAPALTVHSKRYSSRPRPSTGSIKAPALLGKSAPWLPPLRFGETTVGACQCRWPRQDIYWPRLTFLLSAQSPGSRSGSPCGSTWYSSSALPDNRLRLIRRCPSQLGRDKCAVVLNRLRDRRARVAVWLALLFFPA